jgi:hypothetical protein
MQQRPYAANNPLKYVDPSGMSYFVGGSGAADPFITEYRFDGFDQSPDGTFSNLDREEMAGLCQQTDDMNPVAPSAGTIDENGNFVTVSRGIVSVGNLQTGVVTAYSYNAVMVIIWDPQSGTANPTFMFGHASYILMQSDTSLSWQGDISKSWEGWFQWTADTPSTDYTNERSKLSSGMGYVLDFGVKANAKFQAALIASPKSLLSPGYHPILNNCARPFSIAFNAIAKDIGWEGRRPALLTPVEVKDFITGKDPYGELTKYLRAQQQFPKR